MKFYLMWANHDANTLWDIRLSQGTDSVIWKGSVCRQEFERVCHRVISRYFRQPNYYCIDGAPVFQIYDLGNLVDGLGSLEETAQALKWFREETVRAGFPDLHLQLTVYGGMPNLSGVDTRNPGSYSDIGNQLGFASISHYQFAHFTNIDRDYGEILADVKREWEKLESQWDIPYFPHISVGWDNNPRFTGMRPGIVRNNTPDALKRGLMMAKEYADSHPEQPPLITINSWNEWTETSYLEPDDLYGYGYLKAIQEVFG